jgi:hypothetical protein
MNFGMLRCACDSGQWGVGVPGMCVCLLGVGVSPGGGGQEGGGRVLAPLTPANTTIPGSLSGG